MLECVYDGMMQVLTGQSRWSRRRGLLCRNIGLRLLQALVHLVSMGERVCGGKVMNTCGYFLCVCLFVLY